jgi:hypothetical protein
LRLVTLGRDTAAGLVVDPMDVALKVDASFSCLCVPADEGRLLAVSN